MVKSVKSNEARNLSSQMMRHVGNKPKFNPDCLRFSKLKMSAPDMSLIITHYTGKP